MHSKFRNNKNNSFNDNSGFTGNRGSGNNPNNYYGQQSSSGQSNRQGGQNSGRMGQYGSEFGSPASQHSYNNTNNRNAASHGNYDQRISQNGPGRGDNFNQRGRSGGFYNGNSNSGGDWSSQSQNRDHQSGTKGNFIGSSKAHGGGFQQKMQSNHGGFLASGDRQGGSGVGGFQQKVQSNNQGLIGSSSRGGSGGFEASRKQNNSNEVICGNRGFGSQGGGGFQPSVQSFHPTGHNGKNNLLGGTQKLGGGFQQYQQGGKTFAETFGVPGSRPPTGILGATNRNGGGGGFKSSNQNRNYKGFDSPRSQLSTDSFHSTGSWVSPYQRTNTANGIIGIHSNGGIGGFQPRGIRSTPNAVAGLLNVKGNRGFQFGRIDTQKKDAVLGSAFNTTRGNRSFQPMSGNSSSWFERDRNQQSNDVVEMTDVEHDEYPNVIIRKPHHLQVRDYLPSVNPPEIDSYLSDKLEGGFDWTKLKEEADFAELLSLPKFPENPPPPLQRGNGS